MTDEQLSALEAAARAATPGPWMSLDFQPWKVWDGEGNNLLGSFANDCDGAYIAAANPAVVLALIARVRELEVDAARFRWLIKGADHALRSPSSIEDYYVSTIHWTKHSRHRTILEALDAGMKETTDG